MRQDPPFDMAYITATHLLEHIQPKTLVVNDPAAVRNAPEKLLVTHFPELMPPTLITWDLEAIRGFRAEHKDIIVKPLFGNGGAGVFRIKPDDENLGVAAGDAFRPLARAADVAALRAGGAAGRQAHHPGGRRADGRDQPRAGRRRGALQHACRRPAGEMRADRARPRDLRRDRADAACAGA